MPAARAEMLATVRDIEGLYAHLEQTAVESGFLVPGSGSKLRERWRRLFSRVPALEREEVNILRGLSLGIPYISPDIDAASHGQSCCR